MNSNSKSRRLIGKVGIVMPHFTSIEWVDFVRQTAEPDQRKPIQDHLDQGCVRCTKTLNAWRFVVEFAMRESTQQAPVSSVHLARASFAVRRIARLNTGKIEIARLVLDSAQAITVGVRGTPATARQLLYKSGSVCIDLHVQPKPGSESIVVVGQLLDSMSPSHAMGNVPVSLLLHGTPVSSKKTNDFGEFDFGFETPEDVQIAFGFQGQRTLVVPLPDVLKT
jgi:hypothetical protein